MKFVMTFLHVHTKALALGYSALCYTGSLKITTGICYPLSLRLN